MSEAERSPAARDELAAAGVRRGARGRRRQPAVALVPPVLRSTARLAAVRERAERDLQHASLQEYQAAAELRAAIRLFQRRTEEVARRHGLTPQRHALLLMIKGAPDGSERSTVTALTERLQLASSTVTELVARAERVGLIARETDAGDARVSHLRLTPEAARRLVATSDLLSRERERLEQLLARLSFERTPQAAEAEVEVREEELGAASLSATASRP